MLCSRCWREDRAGRRKLALLQGQCCRIRLAVISGKANKQKKPHTTVQFDLLSKLGSFAFRFLCISPVWRHLCSLGLQTALEHLSQKSLAFLSLVLYLVLELFLRKTMSGGLPIT